MIGLLANARVSDQFWETIILIALAIFLVYLIFLLLRVIARAVVRTWSRAYHEILEINENFPNFNELKTMYRFRDYVDTKPKYDRFNFDNFLERILIEDFPDIEDAILSKTAENRKVYLVYEERYNKIEIGNQGGPLFRYIDRKECEKAKLKPVLEMIVRAAVEYTSPKGRNSYSKYQLFGEEAIVKRLEIMKKREEKKEEASYQRQLLTAKLRYEILCRDGHKCVICGRTAVEDGVKLHVDHIIPVSKGGKTEPENLRTLCEECNLGKSDRYVENGVN